MRGLCGTCGRTRALTADGKLPAHWNLAILPCSGERQSPWAPDALTAREQLVLDGLDSAGEILAALPAAGLVKAGVPA